MILSGNSYEKELELGNIVISPFRKDFLNPNSYDLHLGKELYQLDDLIVDPLKEHRWTEYDLSKQYKVIDPGKLYLGHTVELAGSSVYIPKIEGKSTLARLGISIHLTAGYGDIGFIGSWTLEITTVKPFVLRYGMPICQIEFDVIRGDIHHLYNGKYNARDGVGLPEARTDWIFMYDEKESQ
jgi:dCTP deaminase